MSSVRKIRRSGHRHQRPRACFSLTENEFEELTKKKLTSWCAIWDLMLMEGAQDRKKDQLFTGPVDLHKKIRHKISELLKKEEALVDLYTRAAEAARKKEEKCKNKIAILNEQIERDKVLMKMFKQEAYSSCQF